MDQHDILLWKRFDNHLEETYTHLKAIFRQPDYKIRYPKHYQNMFQDIARSIEEYFGEEEKIAK
jgi:hypothetical protein